MIYAYSLLTIVAFALAIKISKRLKSMLFNSFVLCVLFLVALLLIGHIPYQHYMQGNAPLNHLLGLSVVALALPLYEQIRQIAQHWKMILLLMSLASFLSMLTGAMLALLLGATPQIVATILPKSITTPIAMSVAQNMGGVPALTAVSVLVAGLQGSLFGYLILKKLGLKNNAAIGSAIGSVSHVLGTVSCMEVNSTAGSYSSMALVLCGIISSILAPFVFKLAYFCFG